MSSLVEVQYPAVLVIENLELSRVITHCDFIPVLVDRQTGQVSVVSSFYLLCDDHLVEIKI